MTRHGVELLTYADRLGGDLPALAEVLRTRLDVFTGVHVLPFFTPYDGPDAGFDPIDHTQVDPRLGTWDDVRALARDREVTVDLIVNHVSSDSAEFADWLAHGDASPSDGMFLTFDTVFPEGAREDELTAFYRPRPGLPFTAYASADGRRRLVWTTFMPTQVDLDVDHPAAVAYLTRVLQTLRDAGVTTVRLDAVGYAVKTPGTDSFMTPETLRFVERITALARGTGLRVLVEVHAHTSQQQAIAPLVDLVYDFAIPALLLHALGTGRLEPLLTWLGERPVNALTVLDTHDGIGIIDAGPSGDRPGLLSVDDMAAIFARAAELTDGHSALASVVPQWAVLPHQINATFFSALGGDATAYLLCRAVQFFAPGEPQVYYVGLLAGRDDLELFRRTGNGREVNRHRYDAAELDDALAAEAVRALLALVRIRTDHPAFQGEGGDGFSFRRTADDTLELVRSHAGAEARLTASFGERPAFSIVLRVADGAERRYDDVAALAAEGTRE